MSEKSKQPPKQQKATESKGKLLKGVDFYIEKGLYVFTEHYLRKRGYCCGSKCRHCPYEEK